MPWYKSAILESQGGMKKKGLHHLKWSFSLFAFSHRDSCSTEWYFFFPRKWQSCKGPITTGYAKDWIIIMLNFFITLILKWRIFQLLLTLILCTEFLFVHTLMFIISVNSFLKVKNCVSTLRLLNYIRNTLLVYRRSKVNPCEMFGEYTRKVWRKSLKILQ